MFNVGDRIIYASQGICQIDEICEKTVLGVTRDYYVLHPLDNPSLKISIPVDNDIMNKLVDKKEAEEIIESFKGPGVRWIEKSSQRIQVYDGIIKKGDRREISQVANTLMREKIKAEKSDKKFPEKDRELLDFIQNILFSEIAISLNTSFEAVHKRVLDLIKANE
jgi:CarD family transcriptional regulator